MLVLLSTTLNHKDITYHRQNAAASSNSKNICNILFNTSIVSEISSQALKEGVSDSMPQTRATCRSQNHRIGKEGVIHTRMHAQCWI